MPRTRREAFGGEVYHVLNRGVGRMALFDAPADFLAFERVVAEALSLFPGVRLLAYVVMTNHWHLLLWPAEDGELGRFMQRLSVTHVRRWIEFRGDAGNGHVYQGRYKSFPVQSDGHLLSVARYVERNPVRAGMVARAADWPHGSAALRATRAALGVPESGTGAEGEVRLSEWPVARPADWADRVDAPQSAAEEAALRRAVLHGSPFGSPAWVEAAAARHGLGSTLRSRGRPRKKGGAVHGA